MKEAFIFKLGIEDSAHLFRNGKRLPKTGCRHGGFVILGGGGFGWRN